MPGLPELPVNVDTLPEEGTREQKPIYQTQRGKLPEGHEDTRPYINTEPYPMRYREED